MLTTNTNKNIIGLAEKNPNKNTNIFELPKMFRKKYEFDHWELGLVFAKTNTNTNICHTLTVVLFSLVLLKMSLYSCLL